MARIIFFNVNQPEINQMINSAGLFLGKSLLFIAYDSEKKEVEIEGDIDASQLEMLNEQIVGARFKE